LGILDEVEPNSKIAEPVSSFRSFTSRAVYFFLVVPHQKMGGSCFFFRLFCLLRECQFVVSSCTFQVDELFYCVPSDVVPPRFQPPTVGAGGVRQNPSTSFLYFSRPRELLKRFNLLLPFLIFFDSGQGGGASRRLRIFFAFHVFLSFKDF